MCTRSGGSLRLGLPPQPPIADADDDTGVSGAAIVVGRVAEGSKGAQRGVDGGGEEAATGKVLPAKRRKSTAGKAGKGDEIHQVQVRYR